MALIYIIDDWNKVFPFFRGGLEYVSHTQDILSPILPASYSTAAFGFHVGLGAEYEIWKYITLGGDISYHNIADVSVTPTGSITPVKAIQSFYTLLGRIAFKF